MPALEQLSVVVASQAMQLDPCVPQVVTERLLHVPPEQHPEGQVVASQTQFPTTQVVPAEQAGSVPHLHSPLKEQLSAVC